jgi:L-seryl-tRNA(Ser) seleniumtransferase
MSEKPDLSKLPSVDAVLHRPTMIDMMVEYGRPLALEAIRVAIEEIRQKALSEHAEVPEIDAFMARAEQILHGWVRPTLEPVINATGVILHTNLGRAPLSEATLATMQAVSHGYSTLEFDIRRGKRGSRYVHVEDLLMRLTGAEAGLVVNNNASALLLILSALANRKRVLISRTQLVEIGGGFRVPDIMKQSGAKLEEIGATNRVHLVDYEDAIEELPIKMVLRAHQSNFQIVGFSSEPELHEIVKVAHDAGLPFVDDLGSGTFLNTEDYGLEHEMTVQESLDAGSDLVCFSGDKLLGGPQAGVIVGRKDLIAKLRKHPLARAVRADKVALAGLSATLLHYLKAEAEMRIPVWQMISMTADDARRRAEMWKMSLRRGEIIEGVSTVGGGSLPGAQLPTFVLALDFEKPDVFLARLRRARPAIVARVEDERVLIDPRTVLPKQEGALLVELQNALAEKQFRL